MFSSALPELTGPLCLWRLHRPETSLPANRNELSRQSFKHSKIKNGFVGNACIFWYLEVFSQHEDYGEVICHKGIEMSRERSGLSVMGTECGEQVQEVQHWTGHGKSARVMGGTSHMPISASGTMQWPGNFMAVHRDKFFPVPTSSYTLQEKLF